MGCVASDTNEEDGQQRLPTSSASRCVVLLVPPGFELTKFFKPFSDNLNYKLLSVGKLIRDEINKNTQYSQVLLENLEQHKHVNDAILEILLRNLIFQGNFIIQFCPKEEELPIWKRFIKMVDLRFAAIINPEQIDVDTKAKPSFAAKMKEFELNKARVHDIFASDKVVEVPISQAQSAIYERLQKAQP